MFKAHRLLHQSTLGSRVIKKTKQNRCLCTRHPPSLQPSASSSLLLSSLELSDTQVYEP